MKALILSVVLFSLSSIVSAQPLTADVFVINVVCFGANDGAISISNASGGSGVYQYSINGGMSWEDAPDFYSLAPGIYAVGLRDKNNTSNSEILATATITEPAQLEAEVTFTNETIAGANDGIVTVINPSGGLGLYQYQLMSGSIVIRPWQMSNVFTGLAPGFYDVFIGDAMVPFCFAHINTIELIVSNSVTDGTASGNYRLYPVPVDDKVTIELTGNNTAGARATICSQQGKELLVTNINGVKTVLETTALQPGVYLLKVCIEDNCFISKFVKL